MQTVRSFVADNDAAARYAKLSDDGSAFFEIHLDDPNLGGLQLRYRSGACAYDFPPGRWLEVDQTAGRITLLTSFMPLTTLSFDEALSLADQIRIGLNGAGWTELTWRARPTVGNINDNPFARGEIKLGTWTVCGNAGQTASLAVKNAGQAVVGSSVPLGALVRKDPVRLGGEFLLVIDITIPREQWRTLRDLTVARRIAVNGDKNKELSAQVWIDDPDWQPR